MMPDVSVIALKMLPAVLALMIPLVIVVGVIVLRLRRLHVTHETIRRLGELGQPIPPALLVGRDPAARWSPRHQLHVGAISVGLGLGLCVMFFAMNPGGWLWTVGCIPLFVGLAMLAVWRLDPRGPVSGPDVR